MNRSQLTRLAVVSCLIAPIVAARTVQAEPTRIMAAGQNISELRQWDGAVTKLSREGRLRLRELRIDPFVEGRTHERFDQYHEGVRVIGGDIVRQLDNGATVSIFGSMFENIVADTTPALTADRAKAVIQELAGAEVGSDRIPELVLVPNGEGAFVLAYALRVMSAEGLFTYFLDAKTGTLAMKRDDLNREAAKGIGTGVLGDQKKISVMKSGAMFRASDELRPPSINTFDMRGGTGRVIAFLNGLLPLGVADLAGDTDNVWTDGAAVDAHVYAGYVYDYYFKRFGRRGLDNRDIRIVSLVHPVVRDFVLQQPIEIVGLFYLNAAYFGNGVMVYGEGLPPSLRDSEGHQWNYLSGALDIVAHELTHGVTEFTSRLQNENEAGALNEAFSDIMGASAEFFHQPAGNGLMQADYLIGEDVVTPGGIRSMANPSAYGNPDHYAVRYTGREDNGGVHINCDIVSHAFYLAVEGGTNRVSKMTVEGVGAAEREQIEKVFYRAFTELLPSNANFAVARAATIQGARDVYGAGSGAERAITQAWTAVGVN